MTIVPRTGPFSASSALATHVLVPAGEVVGLRREHLRHRRRIVHRAPARRSAALVAGGVDQGRPMSDRDAGDRPADAIEPGAIELVGHGRLPTGAAVAVVGDVLGPRDLDLRARRPRRPRRAGGNGTGDRAGRLGEVSTTCDRPPACACAHTCTVSSAPLARRCRRHGRRPRRRRRRRGRRRRLGVDLEAGDAPDVEHRAAAPGDGDGGGRREAQASAQRGPGRRHLAEVDGADVGRRGGGCRPGHRGVGGLRRPPAAGGGEHGGGQTQTGQRQPRGTRSRVIAHDRRNLPNRLCRCGCRIAA